MLADLPQSTSFGRLAEEVLGAGRSRIAILDFILGQLPLWRDRADRPPRTNETSLTSQLCAHLNSTVRHSAGWDCLQFRPEESDEVQLSRKVDLAIAAAGDALLVEGRHYSDFETILPIECKRLPTPAGTGRDPREYVITAKGANGGIQRYKEGVHGAAHTQAALIAYVQDKDLEHWLTQVQRWIRDLHAARVPGWSLADLLSGHIFDASRGVAVHQSVHARKSLPAVHLRHMWVLMQ